MNYHRVVIQLLTWAIRISEINDDKFSDIVYDRAKKSLFFLDTCLDLKSGNLPNYGANDGALFFKLTDTDFRNFKSQLDDLRAVINNERYYDYESVFWYGIKCKKVKPIEFEGIRRFKKGGYYLFQEEDAKTFIKCGEYKDRPSQADNLHLDIWVNGENILRDSGSYKYNTHSELVNYFNGSAGHNTIGIDGFDQMLKGKRFIWFYWVKYAKAKLIDTPNSFNFSGRS